jgi:hypothetical protein
MATLYFDGAVDTDWNTLGNWRLDDFTQTRVPAASLPTSSDSAVIAGYMDSNSGSEPALVDFTIANDGSDTSVAVTVTGTATITAGYNYSGTITGNAIFNEYAYLSGTVTGNATFNDEADNGGYVQGSATFNGASTMYNGSVSGTATFNGNAKLTAGTVVGNATFNGSSFMDGGVVEGNATFNDTSLLDGSYYPSTYGTVVLNDYATANGAWYAADPTTFNDHANLSNQYVTYEPCEFNDHATCNGFGMGGGATFNDFSVCAATASYGYPIFTFNDSATGGFQVQWYTEPDVTYNDNSYGSGKAQNLTINGRVAMVSPYFNGYNPVLEYSFTRPQYGINGSSILGVI